MGSCQVRSLIFGLKSNPRQLNILTSWKTDFSMLLHLITQEDFLVENVTSDVILYWMSLNLYVYLKKDQTNI